MDVQTALRAQFEHQPVRFFIREYEALLEKAYEAVAAFLGANPDDLAFTSNATAGVNTVLRSLEFKPGDEIVITSHGYNACNNAARFVAERSGANVVVAEIPFPMQSPDEAVAAVLQKINANTRLLLVDHVTSPTAIVLPIEQLIDACNARGIDTLVDGAHAPGMLPLDLNRLGAAYYTGNCHKWLCAPKGAAFLHVRSDKQGAIRPLSISHGANSPRTDHSRFRLEFDWTGTIDPTPWLCIPTAIEFMTSLLPGGMPALMEHNHATALAARKLLWDAVGSSLAVPDSMMGSMAIAILPEAQGSPPEGPLFLDSLQEMLFTEYHIEVPIVPFPRWPGRLVRISAQIYNDPEDYQRLANALKDKFGRG